MTPFPFGHAFVRTLLVLLSIVATASVTRSAHADPLGRVLVVETTGDIDDEASLRDAIAAELHVTVVEPEDPRAASATGTLTIDIRGADKRIAATYRSLGSPVSRTVDLPEDPKRARGVTVLLAGNVARQEADDLLAGLKKQAAPTAVEGTAGGNADLARLHAVIDPLAETQRAHRKWGAIALLVESGLSLGLGTYYLLREPSTEPMRDAGTWLLVNGGISGAFGVGLLVNRTAGYEGLARSLANGERTLPPDVAVQQVEARWAEEAAEDRRWRKISGWIGIGVGITSAAVGFAIPEIVPRAQHDNGVYIATYGFVLLGGLSVALGLHSLFDETATEQSWHVYRQMKAPRSQPTKTSAALKPKLGLAPTPGGGMASLGFSF